MTQLEDITALFWKQRRKGIKACFFIEEDTGILFLEDKEGDLCSYKAVRKVHELNRHKGIEQLIHAYKKSGWMTPELQKIIENVVKSCKVCQKFQKTVARLRMTLPKA